MRVHRINFLIVAGSIPLLWALAPPAAARAALTETCLTGTASDVVNDAGQIRLVRSLVDTACACSSFDGTTGRTHAAYVKCAAAVITAQTEAAALRTPCARTVKQYYANSTCGRNPNQHTAPCITKNVTTGKITCAIKPTTKRDGTPTNTCRTTTNTARVACPGYTQCLGAADTNDNLIITAPGDNGACVGGPPPTATALPPTATASAIPTETATATDTPIQPTSTPTSTPPPTSTATSTPTPTATATPEEPPNPLAYWKFDEGTGSTVADSSGNGHTLSLLGGADAGWTNLAAPTTFSNPFALKLFNLSGSENASAGTIDLADKSFSVAMWVARSALGSATGFPSSFLGTECYSSQCRNTDHLLNLGFSISDNFICGFGNDDLVTPAITSDGIWHHYACTYDVVTRVRKAYKDGVLVGSDQPSGNFVGTLPLLIGLSASGRFAGLVDEGRIYDAALSEAQVGALAERDPDYVPPPCTPHALLLPAGGPKIPQLLQLSATIDNGCEAPLDPYSFTPDPFTFTWHCQSDTSTECPSFLASANAPPNGNSIPMLNLQEFDVIQVWVTICLVDNPSVCSTDDNVYEGAPVD